MSNGKEGTWASLKSGGKVLRLWQTEGGPSLSVAEIAILWLSDAQYKMFAKDQKAFLNSNGVFPAKVNKIIAESTVTPKSDYPGADNWMVMVEHDGSTSNCGVASMLMFHPKPGA